MFTNNLRVRPFLFLTGILLFLTVTACGTNNEEQEENTDNDGATGYGEALDYTITGIEPGAGITVTTEKALEEYDSLDEWTLEQSSTAAMVTELDAAISNEEPIIVTGWNPHWKFAKYDNLKYLEDPKGIYGDAEVIKTLAREGLKQDKPNAYKLLDQFYWEVEDMEEIMFEAQDTGDEIEEIAKRWVNDHPDKVAEWTDGVTDGEGVSVELVSIPWDSERASAGVITEVLTQKGFEVTTTPVDVAVMFEAIANGDGDVTLAAWLPMTHNDFYERYKDQIDDLGANLEGAKIGLVVPDYMDIDSIEDIQ